MYVLEVSNTRRRKLRVNYYYDTDYSNGSSSLDKQKQRTPT